MKIGTRFLILFCQIFNHLKEFTNVDEVAWSSVIFYAMGREIESRLAIGLKLFEKF
jgi:hypothetical protein